MTEKQRSMMLQDGEERQRWLLAFLKWAPRVSWWEEVRFPAPLDSLVT